MVRTMVGILVKISMANHQEKTMKFELKVPETEFCNKKKFLIFIADCEFWKNCQTAMYCR